MPPTVPDPLPAPPTYHRALTILATSAVLGLLYVGRDVLIPVTFALILSLLISPLIRGLRRIGLGHAPSVLLGVAALAVFLVALLAMMGTQVVHMARSLPRYEATIHEKVQSLRLQTEGRLQAVQGEAGRFLDALDAHEASPGAPADATHAAATVSSTGVAAARARSLPGNPLTLVTRVLSSVWVPLQTAGIVLVVLVFLLLEHEALRDRFIRLVGSADLRATTAAIDDAGTRLSRLFVSEFVVNFGVGAVIYLGLLLIGVPNAPLWAALTAVLRFVPYVGVWIAAALSCLLAAAVGPGWSLLLLTMALFGVVELIAGQLIEPQLYGHTTGLSPLAVVIAAIFWSWLWGPLGLILSTPLTLCLVVAGRHVKALNPLDILLGDTPALTLPQRFYQRALAGDAQEIIDAARLFLRRKSFAAYCDSVLLPALQLSLLDLKQNSIGAAQLAKVRGAIVRVIEALGHQRGTRSRWHRHATVIDSSPLGRYLRQQREEVSGRWQGPLQVAPGSVALCLTPGSIGDDVVTELLVRVLRDLNLDGRHLGMDDLRAFDAEPHPEATRDGVALVYIVYPAASAEHARGLAMATALRARLPGAWIVAVSLPQVLSLAEPIPADAALDQVVHSFEAAAQLAISRMRSPAGGEGI